MDESSDLEAVVLFGSLVRGDPIPPSDADVLLVSTDDSATDREGSMVIDDVTLDLEHITLGELDVDRVIRDPYSYGLFQTAIVLCERDHRVRHFLNTLHAAHSDDRELLMRTRSLRHDVDQNCLRLRDALDPFKHEEAVKSLAFAIWCLCEYILVRQAISPGGFRTLSRLRPVDPALYDKLVRLQRSGDVSTKSILELVDVRENDPLCRQKIEWLAMNGFGNEAIHILLISIGLEIKNGSHTDADFRATTSLLGWGKAWLSRASDVLGPLVRQAAAG